MGKMDCSKKALKAKGYQHNFFVIYVIFSIEHKFSRCVHIRFYGVNNETVAALLYIIQYANNAFALHKSAIIA